jgi:hypothetical protein
MKKRIHTEGEFGQKKSVRQTTLFVAIVGIISHAYYIFSLGI